MEIVTAMQAIALLCQVNNGHGYGYNDVSKKQIECQKWCVACLQSQNQLIGWALEACIQKRPKE